MATLLEETVHKTFQEVLRNNSDKDGSILDALSIIVENVFQNGIYSDKELEEVAPIFCTFTVTEHEKILELLNKQMVQYAYNENANYLEVLRIVAALNITGAIDNLLSKNSKIKICKTLYSELNWNLSDLIQLVEQLQKAEKEVVY